MTGDMADGLRPLAQRALTEYLFYIGGGAGHGWISTD